MEKDRYHGKIARRTGDIEIPSSEGVQCLSTGEVFSQYISVNPNWWENKLAEIFYFFHNFPIYAELRIPFSITRLVSLVNISLYTSLYCDAIEDFHSGPDVWPDSISILFRILTANLTLQPCFDKWNFCHFIAMHLADFLKYYCKVSVAHV